MTKRVAIVTDTACDVSAQMAEELGITVVPLTIRFGDDEFVDRLEITNEQFWARLESSATLPSTAAPSPGAFAEAFSTAAAHSNAVVCVTLSSKLSATYQAAVNAAKSVSDTIDVRVVDSESCAVGQGLLCLEASRSAIAGASVDEIVSALEALKKRVRIFAALDSIEHLKKGGRIGSAAALFATMLSFKPIVSLNHGEVQAEGRQRTRSRSLDRLVEIVMENSPIERLAVTHASAPDIDAFLDRLTPFANRDEIYVSDVGPVIGTHIGPRVIAVCFTTEANTTPAP
jgi:DegV family protein with EDD domain